MLNVSAEIVFANLPKKNAQKRNFYRISIELFFKQFSSQRSEFSFNFALLIFTIVERVS